MIASVTRANARTRHARDHRACVRVSTVDERVGTRRGASRRVVVGVDARVGINSIASIRVGASVERARACADDDGGTRAVRVVVVVVGSSRVGVGGRW